MRILSRELTQRLTTADNAAPPADYRRRPDDSRPSRPPPRLSTDLSHSALPLPLSLHSPGTSPCCGRRHASPFRRCPALPLAPPLQPAVFCGPPRCLATPQTPQRLVLSTIRLSRNFPLPLLTPSYARAYSSSNPTQCGHEIPPVVELPPAGPKRHRRRLIPPKPPTSHVRRRRRRSRPHRVAAVPTSSATFDIAF